MSNSGRKRRKIGKVGIHMDWVEITRNFGVMLIGERSVEWGVYIRSRDGVSAI